MQQVIIASICTQSMGKEGEKKGGQGRQADKQRWIGGRTLFAHVKQGKGNTGDTYSMFSNGRLQPFLKNLATHHACKNL